LQGAHSRSERLDRVRSQLRIPSNHPEHFGIMPERYCPSTQKNSLLLQECKGGFNTG
jgi:hypothetical protein